jgi:hypothetical protein
MTPEQKERIRRILMYVAGFADHKSFCASNVEQTSEFCTCDLSKANKYYDEALELLK